MMAQPQRSRKGSQPPAPYSTQLCRVPLPIKDAVMGIIRDYRAKAWAEARQQRKANP